MRREEAGVMKEISLKGKFSLELIKKERFAGSFCGMRYMLMMEDGEMKATVYPEPYCWEATPEEQKVSARFPHTKEGIGEMVAWLNQKYREEYAEAMGAEK